MMGTAATDSEHDPDVGTRVEAKGEYGESLADRVLSLVAMAGAVGGAIGGAVVGAEVGTTFPTVYGMLGSGLAVGGWCLLVHMRTVLFAETESHQSATM